MLVCLVDFIGLLIKLFLKNFELFFTFCLNFLSDTISLGVKFLDLFNQPMLLSLYSQSPGSPFRLLLIDFDFLSPNFLKYDCNLLIDLILLCFEPILLRF